jgi:hypothetical protein
MKFKAWVPLAAQDVLQLQLQQKPTSRGCKQSQLLLGVAALPAAQACCATTGSFLPCTVSVEPRMI